VEGEGVRLWLDFAAFAQVLTWQRLILCGWGEEKTSPKVIHFTRVRVLRGNQKGAVSSSISEEQ
jgi:hypothetical protein